MQAVCQMIMHGDAEFEEALLRLGRADECEGAEEKALAILTMFSLDCTGESTVASSLTGQQTCSAIGLPAVKGGLPSEDIFK